MIDHIEINIGAERGNPEVILAGALAQILAFTQQNNTAASNGSDGRVLLVAGARNQLYLLFTACGLITGQGPRFPREV